jgi:type I restriction enzyme R subunit
LADLISMIKRAADSAAPLLTAEQRVDAAMASVTAGKSLDDVQAQWLERIRSHLVQNLSVDTSDFNVVPLFARHGGLGRARKIFSEDLDGLLADLNEAVAA